LSNGKGIRQLPLSHCDRQMVQMLRLTAGNRRNGMRRGAMGEIPGPENESSHQSEPVKNNRVFYRGTLLQSQGARNSGLCLLYFLFLYSVGVIPTLAEKTLEK